MDDDVIGPPHIRAEFLIPGRGGERDGVILLDAVARHTHTAAIDRAIPELLRRRPLSPTPTKSPRNAARLVVSSSTRKPVLKVSNKADTEPREFALPEK